jgi:hypothetical protein
MPASNMKLWLANQASTTPKTSPLSGIFLLKMNKRNIPTTIPAFTMKLIKILASLALGEEPRM